MCDCGLNGKWCNGHVCGCTHGTYSGRRQQALDRVARLNAAGVTAYSTWPRSTWQERFRLAFFVCLSQRPATPPSGRDIRRAQRALRPTYDWRKPWARLNAQEGALRRELLQETGFVQHPSLATGMDNRRRWYLP